MQVFYAQRPGNGRSLRRIAGVPDAVAVGVVLVRVGRAWAVVAGVADTILVPVALVRVRRPRAVVVTGSVLAPRAAVVGVLPIEIAVVQHAVLVVIGEVDAAREDVEVSEPRVRPDRMDAPAAHGRPVVIEQGIRAGGRKDAARNADVRTERCASVGGSRKVQSVPEP